MTAQIYNPLSDTGRIKASLISLFGTATDLTRLIPPEQVFNTPYFEGAVTDNCCAVFVETHLTKLENRRIKEVGVDITVLCHKESAGLSDEDKTYYESIGVYGNRVDCAVQVIHSAIQNPEVMDTIRQSFSIGSMNLLDKNPVEQYIPGTNFYGKVLHYTYQSFYRRNNSD